MGEEREKLLSPAEAFRAKRGEAVLDFINVVGCVLRDCERVAPLFEQLQTSLLEEWRRALERENLPIFFEENKNLLARLLVGDLSNQDLAALRESLEEATRQIVRQPQWFSEAYELVEIERKRRRIS